MRRKEQCQADLTRIASMPMWRLSDLLLDCHDCHSRYNCEPYKRILDRMVKEG